MHVVQDATAALAMVSVQTVVETTINSGSTQADLS